MRRFIRFVILVAMALFLIVASAAVAMAATENSVERSTTPIADIVKHALTNPAVWATVIAGIVIPLLNAALTHTSTVPFFNTVLTALMAGAFAVAAWIANLGDVVVDWKQALLVFVGALVAAGGVRNTILKGDIENTVSRVVPIDLGPKMTPEKAAAKHGGAPAVPAPPPMP
jgi:hypothetical protein